MWGLRIERELFLSDGNVAGKVDDDTETAESTKIFATNCRLIQTFVRCHGLQDVLNVRM